MKKIFYIITLILTLCMAMGNTVENIANSIIYHEWFGHLMLGYGSHIRNHYKVYEFQMQSPLWEATTFKYKLFT